MAILDFDSPFYRDIALGLLAVALLTAPLWASALHVGEPTHELNRTEVTVNGSGIEYADRYAVPQPLPISENIECAGWGGDLRACSFEKHLLEEGAIPTELYSSNPNHTSRLNPHLADYYRYVQIDNEIYETSYVANNSAQGSNRMYPVDMVLEPAAPEEALSRESIDVDDDDLPSVVAETAQRGPTTTRKEVDIPASPISLDDGTYYRVYQERSIDNPSGGENLLSFLLTYVAPVAGVIGLVSLSRRLEVSYVPDNEDLSSK